MLSPNFCEIDAQGGAYVDSQPVDQASENVEASTTLTEQQKRSSLEDPKVNPQGKDQDKVPTDLVGLAAYLEDISTRILNLVGNEHAFESPLFTEHLAPFLTYSSDTATPPSTPRCTKESLLRSWKAVMDTMPDFHVEVQNVTAVVHPSGRRAHVWFFRKDLKWENAFTKETAGLFHWELRRNGWVIVKQTSMANVVGF